MVQVGLKDEAFKTIQGIIDTTYHTVGYGTVIFRLLTILSYMYQTPEAWTNEGRFRANSYMRPLSVWAIQWAFENAKTQGATVRYKC